MMVHELISVGLSYHLIIILIIVNIILINVVIISLQIRVVFIAVVAFNAHDFPGKLIFIIYSNFLVIFTIFILVMSAKMHYLV